MEIPTPDQALELQPGEKLVYEDLKRRVVEAILANPIQPVIDTHNSRLSKRMEIMIQFECEAKGWKVQVTDHSMTLTRQ